MQKRGKELEQLTMKKFSWKVFIEIKNCTLYEINLGIDKKTAIWYNKVIQKNGLTMPKFSKKFSITKHFEKSLLRGKSIFEKKGVNMEFYVNL